MSEAEGLTLRVNVLDRCNLRCAYCLPGAVAPFAPREALLRPAEYARLARLLAAHRVHKVRFTGGEPLLRPELPRLVAAFRAALPGAHLAVTTNGLRLARRLGALARAGLQSATVHLDSLRPERYRALQGPGEPAQALEAALAAREVLGAAKLNVVVQRGQNDDELGDFLALSARTGLQVRFIELMNTGSAAAYARAHLLTGQELLARLGPVEPLPRASPSDPAALYRAGGVTFGVIASGSAPFCGACNRLRLTPQGALRTCLYQAGGLPLGERLRQGASDAELASLLRLGVLGKQSRHPARAGRAPPFSMSEAGG